MKKMAIMVLGLSLLKLFSVQEAFAQADRPCVDEDANRLNNNRDDFRVQSTTSGYDIVLDARGRRRAVYVQKTDSCAEDGRLKEHTCSAGSNYIQTQTVNCGGRRRGDVCSEGACVAGIVLNSCGTPAGGWRNNTRYVLSQDVQLGDGEVNGDCFAMTNKQNITLDCRGHSIIGHEEGRRVGCGGGADGTLRCLPIGLSAVRSTIELRNCNIGGFAIGISFSADRGSQAINNAFSGNEVGISLLENNNNTITFTNNFSCENTFDVGCCTAAGGRELCLEIADFSVMRGSGNHFDRIQNSCLEGPNPPVGVYSECE